LPREPDRDRDRPRRLLLPELSPSTVTLT
jgi:hypothetical protein